MSNTPSGETVKQLLTRLHLQGDINGDAGRDVQVAETEHSLRQAIEGMVQEVIGSPLPVSELKPHAMSDAAAKKMRQGSELTVDAQLERAEVKINKLFGKE